MQRKKPQQRAFHGMVGLPPEPEPAIEPVEQEQDEPVVQQPEASPADETEIAAETARIEDSADAKEVVSVSCDDPDLVEEIETEFGTETLVPICHPEFIAQTEVLRVSPSRFDGDDVATRLAGLRAPFSRQPRCRFPHSSSFLRFWGLRAANFWRCLI